MFTAKPPSPKASSTSSKSLPPPPIPLSQFSAHLLTHHRPSWIPMFRGRRRSRRSMRIRPDLQEYVASSCHVEKDGVTDLRTAISSLPRQSHALSYLPMDWNRRSFIDVFREDTVR